MDINKFINTIIEGDTIKNLKRLPDESIDFIFADPPYYMQTEGELLRVDGTKFKGIEDKWDKFKDFKEYDDFTRKWLKECKRILKKDATIAVIGSFQNIYRVGNIMQDLGYWILNDIIWKKTNPVPNFSGKRFCNSHETILWCSKNKKSKITFNYKTMKYLNNEKQEKSVWEISLCTGNERLKDENGIKTYRKEINNLKNERQHINYALRKSKDLLFKTNKSNIPSIKNFIENHNRYKANLGEVLRTNINIRWSEDELEKQMRKEMDFSI